MQVSTALQGNSGKKGTLRGIWSDRRSDTELAKLHSTHQAPTAFHNQISTAKHPGNQLFGTR